MLASVEHPLGRARQHDDRFVARRAAEHTDMDAVSCVFLDRRSKLAQGHLRLRHVHEEVVSEPTIKSPDRTSLGRRVSDDRKERNADEEYEGDGEALAWLQRCSSASGDAPLSLTRSFIASAARRVYQYSSK